MLKNKMEGCRWICLAGDGDNWLALVNTVMNLRVPQKRGISWLAEDLLAAKKRILLLCFSQLASP